MPAAQPSIDSLEAAVTQLTTQIGQIKAEKESLEQQIAAGVLTDAQVAQVEKMTEAVLGKSQGPSGLSS